MNSRGGFGTLAIYKTPEELRLERRLRGRRPRYERFYTPFGSLREQRINLGVYSTPAKLFLGVIISRKTRPAARRARGWKV